MDLSSPGETTVQLQKLSQRHKQVLALLAQGIDRQTIASVVEYEPEYITWLARQPVCQTYLKEMMGYNDARLVALTERSVDVISDVMRDGSNDDKLKAAKLQLTAIGRVGRAQDSGGPIPSDDRLEKLAERLVALQSNIRARILNESDGVRVTRVTPAEDALEVTGGPG